MPEPVVTPPAGAPPAPGAAPTTTPPPTTPPPTPPPPISLLDSAAPPPTTPPPTPPPTETEWFYANGVKGIGPVPEWYKATKYKTMDEQAKAYAELEKRLGGFTGAPKDGKYDFKMPDGITGEFDLKDPLFEGFNKWAVEHNLNQDGYQALLSMYAQSLAQQAPDIDAMKASLGEKADERIGAVKAWAAANLDEAAQAKLKLATSGHDTVEVLELVEAIIAKTRQPAMPKPGDVDPSKTALTPEALIRKEMEKPGPNGRPLFFDPSPEGQAHRAKVEKMRSDHFARA